MKACRIMFDTNVWLDYFLDRGERAQVMVELINEINGARCLIMTTPGSLKDIFYIIPMHLKRLAAEKTNPAALREIAWSCVRQIMRLSVIAPGDSSVCLQAITLRDYHDDFEDDLLVAICQQSEASFLVTSDAKLNDRAPVACLSPQDMLALMRSGDAPA